MTAQPVEVRSSAGTCDCRYPGFDGLRDGTEANRSLAKRRRAGSIPAIRLRTSSTKTAAPSLRHITTAMMGLGCPYDLRRHLRLVDGSTIKMQVSKISTGPDGAVANALTNSMSKLGGQAAADKSGPGRPAVRRL